VVKIDNKKEESGTLETDWDFLAPKMIKVVGTTLAIDYRLYFLIECQNKCSSFVFNCLGQTILAADGVLLMLMLSDFMFLKSRRLANAMQCSLAVVIQSVSC